MSAHRVVCQDCGWRGLFADVLKAANPFDPEEEIHGCPHCKGIGTLIASCDESGCWRETSCGTPTPDGYRRTCSEHKP